ncbi:MAG: tRNA N6-adenosine threonylcarbamoyltransferase, partial [Alphaproteobacteria bacterium MarineAlpha2_Bin1]
MIVLGIETSCDETSASVVSSNKIILSNVISSQIDIHRPYGGVVPEIASRSHIQKIDEVIKISLKKAQICIKDVDAIAATAGPGLIGGLIVGLLTSKAIAIAANKPLVGINHLEAHALTPRLTNEIKFPYLLLLVSGGHTQILEIQGIRKYKLLGGTLDDACGECFDKVSKLLNLGFPGGPAIEEAAKNGDEESIDLPRPMINHRNLDFSFSGLKTAVLNKTSSNMNQELKNNIAASFQKAVGDIFYKKIEKASDYFFQNYSFKPDIVISGGVASNEYIKGRLLSL